MTKYSLLRKIGTGAHEIDSMKHLGNDFLAVRFSSHIDIYNYKTGECVQTLNCDAKFSKEFFMCSLRSRKLLTIDKFKIAVCNWESLERCDNSSMNHAREVNFACQLSDGTVACAQRSRPQDQRKDILLCELDNLKLVRRGCIESAHASQMSCLLALPKKCLASSAIGDCEIKIYNKDSRTCSTDQLDDVYTG